MSKVRKGPRTKEMLKMWLQGKSYAEIGRLQIPPISRQRVSEILRPLDATRTYIIKGAEASPDSPQGGIKGFLDKIILKVKKTV